MTRDKALPVLAGVLVYQWDLLFEPETRTNRICLNVSLVAHC